MSGWHSVLLLLPLLLKLPVEKSMSICVMHVAIDEEELKGATTQRTRYWIIIILPIRDAYAYLHLLDIFSIECSHPFSHHRRPTRGKWGFANFANCSQQQGKLDQVAWFLVIATRCFWTANMSTMHFGPPSPTWNFIARLTCGIHSETINLHFTASQLITYLRLLLME